MKITKRQLEKLVEGQVKQIVEGKKKVAKIIGAIQMLSPEDKQLFFSQMSTLAANTGTGAHGTGSGGTGSISAGDDKKESLKRMLQSEDFTMEEFRSVLGQLQTKKNKSTYLDLYYDAEMLDDQLEDYSIDSDGVAEIIDDMMFKIDQL